MFNKLRHKLRYKKFKKLYPDWEDDEYNVGAWKFIWGIKSYDDLSSGSPSFYSMNDLELYYDRENKCYGLAIETIYCFDSDLAEVEYLRNLRQRFKNYLISNNIELNYKPKLNKLIYDYDYSITTAETLPELYYKFDLFVKGFENYLEAANGNK